MNTQHPNRALSVNELEQRRLAAGRLFRKGKTAYFVRKRFGVSSTTAREWKKRWEAGTLEAQPQGARPKLTPEQEQDVAAAILKGPETYGYRTQLWTLSRLTDLIRSTAGVAYRPRSVWHLVVRLGFSSQRPARRAKERDEAAIQRWKKTEWPKLEKRGLGNVPPSVSGTNPGTRSARPSGGLGGGKGKPRSSARQAPGRTSRRPASSRLTNG